MRIIDDEVHNNADSASGSQQKIIHKSGGMYKKYVPIKGKKGDPFREEVKKLMFGFGDVQCPNEKSLDLMEAFMEEVMINLLLQASRRSQRHGSNALRLSDVLHIIRKDEKKFLRMPYIINAYREIERTTAQQNTMNKYLDEDTKKNLKLD